MLFVPMTILIVGALLWGMFRSMVAVFAPLVVVVISIVWALGAMGWLGWEANILTTIVPSMLIAVGVADAVHLLQQFRFQIGRSKDVGVQDGLKIAFVDVLRPCLITTLTTAVGMGSLAAATLLGIREMGVVVAIGVVSAFFLTMGLLPMLLLSMPVRWFADWSGQPNQPGGASVVRLARWATRPTVRMGVLGVGTLLAAAAIMGITQLKFDVQMRDYFYSDDPVIVELDHVDEAIGGSLFIEMLVEAQEGESVLEPDTLRRIESAAAHVAQEELIGEPLSLLAYLKETRRLLRGDPVGMSSLPDSRAEAAQILLFLEGATRLDGFITADHRVTRVEFPIHSADYTSVVQQLDQHEATVNEMMPAGVSVQFTGLTRLMGQMQEHLLVSQIRSFGLAFCLVVLCIAVLFRSLRVGLITAVPNLLPIVSILGVMGWLGVSLDLSNVMVAPLLLGLVVDDTVHVTERLLGARAKGATIASAFETSVSEVGHAVVITSIVLAAGFIVLAFGSFRPNMVFAVIAATGIFLALLGNLVVYPAVGCLFPSWIVSGDNPADQAGAGEAAEG